jgi:hypothetical protein
LKGVVVILGLFLNAAGSAIIEELSQLVDALQGILIPDDEEAMESIEQ